MNAREKELTFYLPDIHRERIETLRKCLKIAMASVPLIVAIFQAVTDILDELERTEP